MKPRSIVLLSVSLTLLAVGALWFAYDAGRDDGEADVSGSAPTTTTTTQRTPSTRRAMTTTTVDDEAAQLVKQACVLSQRLVSDDAEILRIQEEQLTLLAEAESLDASWRSLREDYVKWNAVIKSQISGSLSGSEALSTLSDGTFDRIDAGCRRAGVEYANP